MVLLKIMQHWRVSSSGDGSKGKAAAKDEEETFGFDLPGSMPSGSPEKAGECLKRIDCVDCVDFVDFADFVSYGLRPAVIGCPGPAPELDDGEEWEEVDLDEQGVLGCSLPLPLSSSSP